MKFVDWCGLLELGYLISTLRVVITIPAVLSVVEIRAVDGAALQRALIPALIAVGGHHVAFASHAVGCALELAAVAVVSLLPLDDGALGLGLV